MRWIERWIVVDVETELIHHPIGCYGKLLLIGQDDNVN